MLSDRLHIGADAGYEFDFLPASLPEPDSTTFATPADAPAVAVSGIYTGDVNDTLTFKVQATSGSGSVGNGAWSIAVTAFANSARSLSMVTSRPVELRRLAP